MKIWNPPCKRCIHRTGNVCEFIGPFGLLDPIIVYVLGCKRFDLNMDPFEGEYK